MFLQLGTYKFEGVKLPQSLSVNHETNYGQIPIISGKPVVQKTGQKLDEIEITAFFSSSFCIPKEEIASLQGVQSRGEILNLVDGTGFNYGKFVLTKVQVVNVTALDNGYPTQISANLSLLEYNNQKGYSQQTGTATNAVPQTAALPIPSTGMTISQTITSGELAASNISQHVATQPTSGMYGKIGSLAQTAINYFNAANTQVEGTKKIVYRALNLKTSLNGCIQAAQDVKTATTIKSYNNLLTANNSLTYALLDLKSTKAPLIAFVGSREGGI